MGIKKETIEFVEKAKQYFESEEGRIFGNTYRDKNLGYIALRWGMFEDCIKVFELGEEVALFENWFDRVPYEDQIDHYIERIDNNNIYMTKEHIEKLQNIIKKRLSKIKM